MINSICKYICIVILLILCGCSGSKSTPVEPTSEIPDALSAETNSTHSLMGIWDIELDIESMEASVVQNRDPMYHFNVGSFLPPPIVGINSWDAQSEIVDVDVVIRNTSIYDGYDVRMIVFYDDARHRLMNADNFTHLWDIPQGFYANGFKAYAKSEPYRKFRSLQLKMENFQILCPNSNFNVQIAIDASYPGNCSEPYLMDNFRQGALIEYVGATADVRVDVYDWQNDVDSVRIQCQAITGEPDTYFTQEGSKTWKLDLVNNTGAVEGEYPALLVATSTNSGTLQLLDEVMISIYTADNVGWARTWGGVGDDKGEDVAVDNVGNVYVTGDFSNTVDFNPDPAEEEWRTSIAPVSAFLSKFDKYGDFKWVNTFGDTEPAGGHSVDTDNAGNIFVAGTFHNTVDFDPGDGVDEHTSNGEADIFLSKYASNGNYLGTVTWGGGGTDAVTDIFIDNQNSVSTTGYFEYTVDFNPDPLNEDRHSTNGQRDTFISKIKSTGEFLWAVTWGGSKDDYGLGVSSDSAGNVYCSGYFWSSAVDFDPGPGTEIFTSQGWWDAFLSKFDSDGNFVWAGAWGGTYQDDAAGVTVDEYDDVYVTGRFYYTVDFDPDPIDVAERTAVLSADAYLSKFTPDGDLQWVFAWGGQTLDKCLEVETNKSGKVNVAGEVLGRNMIKNFDLDGNEVWIADWYQNANILGLDVSAEGNSFCSGQYKSPSYVDFDPGDGEWYSDNFAGGVDSFIIKVLPNGLWY